VENSRGPALGIAENFGRHSGWRRDLSTAPTTQLHTAGAGRILGALRISIVSRTTLPLASWSVKRRTPGAARFQREPRAFLASLGSRDGCAARESYDNQEKRMAGRNFHMATRDESGARVCARFAATILILATGTMLAGGVCAQGTGGYMRCVSASGRAMPGVSTDATFNGWIPLRQTTMPTAAEMSAMTSEDAATAAKDVHPPIVVVKDRDSSSLAILGAFTSKQRFPEIDIALTDHSDHPAARYKLTDATIIAVRASVTPDAAQEPVEQLRITYAKIEVQ